MSHLGARVKERTARNFFIVRSLGNKPDKIQLLASVNRSDLIAFTKTWLLSDILDSEVQIPGYYLCQADRIGGRLGGGDALLEDRLQGSSGWNYL